MKKSLTGGLVAGFKAFTSTVAGNWFGPLDPIPSQAPADVAGRLYNIRPGYNLDFSPRPDDQARFEQLRALAKNYDLLRIIIETRKDQLATQDWEIQNKDKTKRSADDPRIKQIMDFMIYPDRVHSRDTWTRMLVDDLLIIDAPTIYPRRTLGGGLYSLDVMDGAMIKPLLDEWGRQPDADRPAFQQVLNGVPGPMYRADQLVYRPRNKSSHSPYGYSPVEQVMMTINIGMRRQISQLDYYTSGNTPEALAGVPATWSPEQITEFQMLWDALMEGNQAQRRRMKFVPGEIARNLVQLKTEMLKDEFDEWIARVVCYCFSVSNQAFVKQMNRATAETAQEAATSEGLSPLKAWFKDLIDFLLRYYHNAPDLELAWREEEDVDPMVQANVNQVYVKLGALNLNQVLASIGRDGIGPLGDVHRVYTATGAVPLEQCDKPPERPPMLGHNGGPLLDQEPPASPPGGRQREGRRPPKPGGKGDPDDKEEDSRLVKAAIVEQAPGSPKQIEAMHAAWLPFLTHAGILVAHELAAHFDALTKAAAGDDGQKGRSNDIEGAPVDAIGATEAAGAGTTASSTPASEISPAIVDAIDAALKRLAWQGIQDESDSIIQAQAAEGVSAQVAVIGDMAPTVDMLKLANPRAVAWASEHAAELVAGIDDATRSYVQDIIVQGLEQGWSAAKLQDAIMASQAFSPKRAMLIATHEMATADVQGNVIAAGTARDTLGLEVDKQAILGLNENHCTACLANVAAGKIPLDKPFPTGQRASPFHPRCGCGTTFHYRHAETALNDFEKSFSADEPRDPLGRWSAAAEIHKGLKAIDRIVAGEGDQHNAMHLPGVGQVHFIVGERGQGDQHRGGYGFAKILSKHGEDGARSIPETLTMGTQSRGPTRIVFEHDGNRAVLARNGNGPADGHWVLSGFKGK